MKQAIYICLAIFVAMPVLAQKKSTDLQTYSSLITSDQLSGKLHYLASDYFKGRGTGTEGCRNAARYIALTYKTLGIRPMLSAKGNDPLSAYLQEFPYERRTDKGVSENVIAFMEGSDPKLSKEVIVLSAHYDHLGQDVNLQGDNIYNGSADDGSGTVALLQMAESFASAKKAGKGPKRSILFAHFSAEEIGRFGSAYFVIQAPTIPLEQIIVDINLDGVGGKDPELPAEVSSKYVYLLAIDSTSSHLYRHAETINKNSGLDLQVLKPRKPEDFRSDNMPFESMLIPTLYFSTGLTDHYHKVTDEPGTIDYDHMSKVVKLIFNVAWELLNGPTVPATFNRASYKHTGKYLCPPCGCEYDGRLFDTAGICSKCLMHFVPEWGKKDNKDN